MEPTDHPSEAPLFDQEAPARPWGPGSPAPGAPVSAFDVSRDESQGLRASRASELYEAARFPDLEEVAAAASPKAEGAAASGDQPDVELGKESLPILGVPAPREIAGPVLAALALVGLVFGWRRARRRRRS